MNSMNGQRNSILMNIYVSERPVNVTNHINNFGSNAPGVSTQLSFIDSPPKVDNKINASRFQSQSSIALAEKSSSGQKLVFIRRVSANIFTPTCQTFFPGLLIGALVAGIVLAVVLTMWLTTASVNTDASSTTTITTTSTTTVTTSTTTTSTTMASATALSNPSYYCGCSNFILSLSSISFGTTNTTYQWQSSPTGQNIWSSVNAPSSVSTLTLTSQVYSTDYQCQITVVVPSSMNLTSTLVTVITSNTSYCQTRLVDCTCCGDDINNFILTGELSTQIMDLSTNCSAGSYDNRTQESVTLYISTNYTAYVSTQYSSGERLAIWIDFNGNFIFESFEQVAYGAAIATSNTAVAVAIPSISSGASTGVHRMRATLAYGSIPNSCGSSSTYGETHDYTVNILTSPG